MARAALRLTVRDLAARAGVGTNTVVRFEAGQDARRSTGDRIAAAFGEDVQFLSPDAFGPGVRVRSQRLS